MYKTESRRIVVIGAGIMGAAAAYRLAASGNSVTLIEKGGVASSASGANLGQISILDRPESWHESLARRTIAYYKELVKKAPQIEFEQSGGFYMIERECEFALAEENVKRLAAEGIPADIIRGVDIKKYYPLISDEKVLGFLHTPVEGLLYSPALVCEFVRMSRSHGANVHEYEEVTGFRREGRSVTEVITDKGSYPCDAVVMTGGSWTKKLGVLLDSEIDLGYVRGTAFVAKKQPLNFPGLMNGSSFIPGNDRVNPADEDGHEIWLGTSQRKDGDLLIAQANQMTDVDSKDVSLTAAAKVAKKAIAYFPGLRNVEIVRIWSAVTPLSKDGHPFYGYLQKADNVLVAAGFAGAFSVAPAVAECIVEDIASGRVDREIGRFRPER